MYLLLALSFTLPIWNIFNGVLQKLAALFTYLLIKLSYIPIHREGLHLFLPNGTFIVADYCSGLRQQIIALTLITFFSYLNKIGIKRLVVLYAITVIVAFVINLIRIYIIVLAGYFTDMITSLVDDHSVLGWLLFGGGMTLYIFILNKYLNKLERAGVRL